MDVTANPEPTIRTRSRRRSEAAKRLPWLSDFQLVLGWAVILFLVALLGAIYLTQTSRIARVGRGVQILQNQLETLKRENSTLERQIAEGQSLDKLQDRAVTMGFVRAQPTDIEYIVVPNYPSEPAVTLTPKAAPSAAPVETIGDALRLAARDLIGDLIYGESP